jgi:alanine-glyoxylate transaminase/serine-glyoxylate transaminase/serine-pyruvate transaminase
MMRRAHRLTQRITTRQASAIAPTAGQGVNPAPTHMLPPVSLLVEQPEVGAFNPPKRLLMGPGPGNAHPRVHAAMALPQIGHMDGAFLQMAEEIKEMLRYAWQTKNPFTVPCSGTGSAAWEALCANLTSPGDKHLVLVNGYFGLRHCDMASRYGAEIIKLEKPWGEVFTPEEVDAACQEHKPDMIWVAHAETSTGACQPMDQLGEIARNHDCLLAADTVTSIGGLPVRFCVESNFGRPTPSTRCCLRSCVCSMAWRFHAIDATFSSWRLTKVHAS